MKNDQRAMIISRVSLTIKENDSHDMLLILLIVPLIFTLNFVMSLIGHMYCEYPNLWYVWLKLIQCINCIFFSFLYLVRLSKYQGMIIMVRLPWIHLDSLSLVVSAIQLFLDNLKKYWGGRNSLLWSECLQNKLNRNQWFRFCDVFENSATLVFLVKLENASVYIIFDT